MLNVFHYTKDTGKHSEFTRTDKQVPMPSEFDGPSISEALNSVKFSLPLGYQVYLRHNTEVKTALVTRADKSPLFLLRDAAAGLPFSVMMEMNFVDSEPVALRQDFDEPNPRMFL